LLPGSSEPEVWHQWRQAARGNDHSRLSVKRVLLPALTLMPIMASAYAWATWWSAVLVPLTFARLAAAAGPSFVDPLRIAIDDHQTANARYLAARGGRY